MSGNLPAQYVTAKHVTARQACHNTAKHVTARQVQNQQEV